MKRLINFHAETAKIKNAECAKKFFAAWREEKF